MIDDKKIENRTIGKVIFIIKGNPVVVCGKGLLLLTSIIDDSSGKNILPLKKLRTRFK
jgi:methionyl-tRNA formyltransferase